MKGPKIGFKYVSDIDKWLNQFDKFELKNRNAASRLIEKAIKKKANSMKITGGLEKGVYHYYTGYVAHIGIHYPANHAYLIEFGHLSRNKNKVKAYPIVYPTFQEKANEVAEIMSREYDV